MSILIKGMEMPVTCCQCKEMVYNSEIKWEQAGKEEEGGWVCLLTGELIDNTKREEHCPLVEVPTPHGRLKDVDVIIKDECHSCDGCCEVIECDCLNCTKAGCDTIRALNDAPTIIEAEE